jgi:hypothetical protein
MMGVTKMNRIKTLIGIAAFSLVMLALPSVASAQWGGNNGGYGNGPYNNGRYSRDIQGTVRNIKNRARSFENLVDRYDNRQDDRWNNRNNRNRGYNSDDLENLADDFKNAADKFEDAYGRGRNLSNSQDEARRLLDIGSRIDQALSYSRGNNNHSSSWNAIRNDLRVVADVYGYNYNNRNNRNNRNNNGRGISLPWPF